MTSAPQREGLLFVHAHPDDESLATGIAIAHYARLGHPVHVLTATLGEEGEVIPPELRHLAADREDRLGPYRREELRAAMAALGVEHRVLGEDPARGVLSRYRDSGMAGTPSAEHPDAFINAGPSEAAALVADVIREVRPAVVATYDQHGGYDHPDHIQTHRVTRSAVASLPEGERPLLYAVVTPRSWARADRAWLAEHPAEGHEWRILSIVDPYPPSVVDDGLVTHEVADAEVVRRQIDALREHRTQVTVVGCSYALSNNIAGRLSGREGYTLLDPESGALLVPPAIGAARSRRAGLLEDEA